MTKLKSVELYFDVSSGLLYAVSSEDTPILESYFHILDTDGRTYDFETFKKLISKEDLLVVLEYLMKGGN